MFWGWIKFEWTEPFLLVCWAYTRFKIYEICHPRRHIQHKSLNSVASLHLMQLYLTQTLFKANFIFQTKGDNIITLDFINDHLNISNTFHIAGLQKKWRLRCWKPSLLLCPYCTLHDYIITADGTRNNQAFQWHQFLCYQL